MLRRFLIGVFIAFLPVLSFAQAAAIPTPDEYLGYKLGDRFTPWNRILDYFDELAKRSSLITVQRFGETYEHRPLAMAVITSPKNRARLDAIRQDVAAIASGLPDAAHSAELAKNNPVIVWLGFGIHGNESSSAEAAMEVAATLLRDPDSQPILENSVVIIDPLQNPDGRERYIQWFTRTTGASASANADAFEHAEAWPSGRYNHYLIDMNRDWAWTSQQESRARVAQYRQWNPQVFVDFHEMGTQSSYFFPPDAKPINTNVPKDVEKWLEVFGRSNAAAFSAKGWPFFVAERFDLFYPGYGDSWPSLHGAIGMTYEVAGGGHAGVAVRRDDETILTLADRIARHYTTGMATLHTASDHREDLLRYTGEAMRAGMDGKNTYFIDPSSPNASELADMLRRQSVAMNVLTAPLTIRAQRIDLESLDSHTFPAGTIVVSTRQALGGLVQTLMERSPVFSKGFLEEQRQKAQADEADDFYDLTSWSLPLAMNVDAYVTSLPVQAQLKPYPERDAPVVKAASYGYLMDGNDPGLYRAAGAMLASRINFSVSDSEINAGDKTFARGTIIVLKGNNGADLQAAMSRIARKSGVSPVALDSGWLGNSAFGSEKIHYIKDPKIALVGGSGTSASSFGMMWHTLDIDTAVPHTTIALDSLRGTSLDHYNVIVLPDGDNYSDHLGKRGVERLQAWVRAGGTLVAVRGASAFLREKEVEISKLKPWEPAKPKGDDAKPQEERYNDYRIPGSAFRTTMSERSYLTFGVPKAPAVLIEGSMAFLPVSHKVDNIVTIDAKNPLVSGVAWPESLDRLKGSVYLVSEPYGRGTVITFADEPHYRLFWRATLPLFLNAVMYSPSFPRD